VLRSGSLRRFARRQPFRTDLGATIAIIAVQRVPASPSKVVRAPFLYSIGSVDNSYTPAIQQPIASRSASFRVRTR
jgi:hypothetical protein